MIGIFNSIDHSIPKNSGSFRCIDIKLRENCVVGIPHHPTSTSVATTNVADRVANSVQAAIAEMPTASHGRMRRRHSPAAGVISASIRRRAALREPDLPWHDWARRACEPMHG